MFKNKKSQAIAIKPAIDKDMLAGRVDYLKMVSS